MVYPKYYCPTRWIGILEALKSIVNASDLHKAYCRSLIDQGYRPDRGTDDPPPEEARTARTEDVDVTDEVRHHEDKFHQWGTNPWDLDVEDIAGDVDVMPENDRIAMDDGPMSTLFVNLVDATRGQKKSKLIAEKTGMTDLNLGLDAFMLDALQPYKRLVERLQTQNRPVGHLVCGWIHEMFDSVNDFFLGDSPCYDTNFTKWMNQGCVSEDLINQVKSMGRSFLRYFLQRVKYRLQPYWKFLMGLELANPCSAAKVAPGAWEGVRDLLQRAGYSDEHIIKIIRELKIQRRKAGRWNMGEIASCNRNLLDYYHQRTLNVSNVETKFSWADKYARLVFSLHVASAIIETYFSKTKYIKSKTRMKMNDQTVALVLHLAQTPGPAPDKIEVLVANPVSIDTFSASTRIENDIQELQTKYLDKELYKLFKDKDGNDVLSKGVVKKIEWVHEYRKFLFHVRYDDGDEEDLYLYELRQHVCV